MFSFLQKAIGMGRIEGVWSTGNSYLHDESFQRNSFEIISVFVIELEIVMEYEGGLHIHRHLEPDCCRA